MTRLVLASFNAHWGVRPRGMTSGPRGAAFDVDAVFRRLGADVVVLQESWRPDEGGAFVDDIAVEHGYHLEELPLARAVAGHRPRVRRPGTGTWGLAVLTRLPVVARRELPLGSVPRDPVGDRHALHLRLDVGGGAEMDLVAAHTSSRVPYGPLLHLRRLAPSSPTGSGPRSSPAT
ncbi:MAG: hypothetical protein M5U14_12440 [Acidimicrobiia bacterium]|nr:hypothetical protein [Acidimicrobiia bacterium]